MMSHDGVVTLISHGGCAAMRASYRALSTHGYKMGLESFRKQFWFFFNKDSEKQGAQVSNLLNHAFTGN